jgi:hypothetical protein
MLCGFFFLIEEDSLGNGSLNLDLNNGSCSGLERVWLVDWDKSCVGFCIDYEGVRFFIS